MMNKRGLQISKAFYAVIVFSVVIIAVGVIVGGWGDKYDSGISYDLSEYDRLDEFSQEAQTQKDKITPSDDSPGTGDFEGKILSGGYGILGRVFLPFNSVFNMFQSVEERFGLPSYVSEAMLTLIFIAFITAIIGIIFRLGRPA